MLALDSAMDRGRQAKAGGENKRSGFEPLWQFFARGSVDDLELRVGPGFRHSIYRTMGRAS